MSKRILTLFCMLILVLGLFVPVSSVRAYDEDYGKEAWECLQYIDANLGYRLSDAKLYTDTKNHDAAGAWIKSKLESYGYSVHVLQWTNAGTLLTSYYVRKPGISSKRIVVGAHYDSVDTKGVEDNGTGVSAVLELAKRFADYETPLTIDFCFWDGEETMGFSGSYNYIETVGLDGVLCNINIDCIGAGDTMFAYGGEYEDGALVRTWPLYMAMDGAYKCGSIPLNYIPKEVNEYWACPTRTGSSDHYYFNKNGIPYVYFECNRWIDDNGNIPREEKPQLFNTADPAMSVTGGQIIHTPEFEDLAVLESIFPGRIRTRLKQYSKIVSWMLRYMDETSPGLYQHEIDHTPAPTEPTETETETPAPTEPTETETETETPTTGTPGTGEVPSAEPTETAGPPATTGEAVSSGEPQDTSKPPETTEAPEPGQEKKGISLGAYLAIAGGISALLIAASVLLRRR